MSKYLKTVDFIKTNVQKIIMFKINLFYPHRISTKNTKLHDLENEGQGQFKSMALENYWMGYYWFIMNMWVK